LANDKAGNYQLAVTTATGFDLDCTPGGRVEGKSPLDGSGDDVFNSGCSTSSLQFQTITGGREQGSGVGGGQEPVPMR